MTEAIVEDWIQLGKLVEMVRAHKIKSVETRIGPFKIKIHRLITTIRIDLTEVGNG